MGATAHLDQARSSPQGPTRSATLNDKGLSGGSGLLGLLRIFDHRLKDNVAIVGTLFDGTSVYRYRYKGAPAYHIGLMAQDVEQSTPGAVVEINGYKAVDYRAATEASRKLHEAA
jgi:hypothetical protein